MMRRQSSAKLKEVGSGLPTWSLWESWAKEGLDSAEKRMAEGKFHSGPTVDSVAQTDFSES